MGQSNSGRTASRPKPWRRLQKVALLGIALQRLISPAFADEAPPIPKEINIVTADQLKKLLDGRAPLLLIDSRVSQEFKEGHIPRAINVVDKDMEAHKAKFPADKNHPIIFYCNGYPKCVRSLNGAKLAMSWGYKNLSVYTAGIPDWEQKGYPIERK